MTKVFIGGSRHVSRLSAPVRARIDRIIEKELPVIVGDANGADKSVQTYLSKQHYLYVEVFCSGGSARNNVGGWQLRTIAADSPRGTLDFYSAKDRAMAHEAGYGLMVWDGKSAGTLLNVFRLLTQHKKVALYAGPEKRFIELKAISHWDAFVSRYPAELRRKVELRASSEPNGTNRQPRSHASGQLVFQHMQEKL
ncbi:MAG TPA: hypothetical protein VM755_10690 [Stellaceae bacterium]|nr:hypothetical protein [Stellaceae bacterium]